MTIKYFDLHCDTAGKAFDNGMGLYANSLCVDLKRMDMFDSPQAFFAVWVTKEEHPKPFERACGIINFIKEENRGALIYPAIEGDLDNIYRLKEMGVRLFTVAWNDKNELASGVLADGGLTTLGKRAVCELEQANIVVDVSHLNEDGFSDVCNTAKCAFIASHSNAYNICENPRNLKDWQIKAISERGGLIGLNIYSDFVAENAKISDVLRHAGYIMELTKSDNCVAIGTDFDGMERSVKGMEDITGMKTFAEELTKSFGIETAEKILWKNATGFFNFCHPERSEGS